MSIVHKTISQEDKVSLEKLTTVSSKIRFLDSQSYDRGSIAKILNIRYQWVRNVLITPIKNQR